MLITKVYSLSVYHFPTCTHARLKLKTVRMMNMNYPENLGSKSFPPQAVEMCRVTDPDKGVRGGGRRMPPKSAVHQN